MAKGKKKRGKQGAVSKVLNIFGIIIGFARPIQILIETGFSSASLQRILSGLTFGLDQGSFRLSAGLKMYAPVGAALGYRQFTKFLMRSFPVR